MRALDPVDPSIYSCGPATEAVRALLRSYAAIDWYEPPSIGVDEARDRFMRHHDLAREHAPDLFGERPEVELRATDFVELAALTERVREHGREWDWKYGALKPMGRRHADRCGWTKPGETGATPAPSPDALFFRVGDAVIWNLASFHIDLSALDADATEAAAFYSAYGNLDLIGALEWQLAQPDCPLERNPFAVLLSVYAGGYLPFHLTASSVVLAHFSPAVGDRAPTVF